MSRAIASPERRQYYVVRLLSALAYDRHPRTHASLTRAERTKLTACCARALIDNVFRIDYGANLTPAGVPRAARRRTTLLPVVTSSVVLSAHARSTHGPHCTDASGCSEAAPWTLVNVPADEQRARCFAHASADVTQLRARGLAPRLWPLAGVHAFPGTDAPHAVLLQIVRAFTSAHAERVE